MPPNKRTRELKPAQGSKKKGGHLQSTVWEYFIQIPLSTAGHFAAKCLYCKKNWPCGWPQELEVHLTKDCIDIDDETRKEYI